MSATGTEIEIKMLVYDLAKIETRLRGMGARLVQPRIFEQNLRFDLPDASLRNYHRVLRLRQDVNAVLTYKGPGKVVDGIRAREEWEVTVSDFAVMRKIIESLGYDIQFIYEKYRTTYDIEQSHVMLDETPLGSFVEIEGADEVSIFSAANHLQLDSTTAIPDSYQLLFEQAKTSLGLTFRDMTFNNFANTQVQPSTLGVRIADF